MSSSKTRKNPPRVKMHYSQMMSRPFWRRINALPDPNFTRMYAWGVALQNLEQMVWDELLVVEKENR